MKEDILIGIGVFIGAVAIILGLMTLNAYIVSLLVPYVFGYEIGFWRSLALLILCSILFKDVNIKRKERE
jgi:hypothetical protein